MNEIRIRPKNIYTTQYAKYAYKKKPLTINFDSNRIDNAVNFKEDINRFPKRINYENSNKLQNVDPDQKKSNQIQEQTVRPKTRITIKKDENEMQISTRLEQLSWVPARKLLATRSKYEKEPAKYEWFNRLIKRSLYSIYTQLSRFQLPPPKEKPKPMSREDRAMHMEHIKKLAKPRFNMKNEKSAKREKSGNLNKVKKPNQDVAIKEKKNLPTSGSKKLLTTKSKDHTKNKKGPSKIKLTSTINVPKTQKSKNLKNKTLLSSSKIKAKK